MKLALVAFFIATLPCGLVRAQLVENTNTYSAAKYGYSLVVPQGWNSYDTEYTALKGGSIDDVFVTQYSDLVSRPTKYFHMYAGSPSSIFGVSNKVVQKVTREQLIDFYIDQLVNSSVNLTVVNTSATGTGDDKVYKADVTYATPGFIAHSSLYFQFKNSRVYVWSTTYLNGFETYSSTLDAIARSVRIQ